MCSVAGRSAPNGPLITTCLEQYGWHWKNGARCVPSWRTNDPRGTTARTSSSTSWRCVLFLIRSSRPNVPPGTGRRLTPALPAASTGLPAAWVAFRSANAVPTSPREATGAACCTAAPQPADTTQTSSRIPRKLVLTERVIRHEAAFGLREESSSCGRGRALRRGRLVPQLELDLRERLVACPLLQRDPLREELPRGSPGGEQRQGDEDPGEAVDLAPRQEAEDHEQRVKTERAPHHLWHNDVTLELLDPEEQQGHPQRREWVLDQRVQHRRRGPEPRAEVRDQLGEGRPGAERRGVLPSVRHQPDNPEEPQADSYADADDQRDEELPLDVARDRPFHPHDQPAAPLRREASVEGVREPLHVEQHVDRDDNHEKGVEEQRHNGQARSLRPAQRLGRVLLDVLRSDLVEEPLALVLDVDAAEVMTVEPALKTGEVVLGARLRWVSGIGRKVVVHSVGAAARLLHDHRGESEDRECDDRCEREIDERNRRSAWDPDPAERADERIEEQCDEQCHEEQEEHVTHGSRHRPHEQEQQWQQHELRPTRDLDAYRRRRRHASDGNRGIGNGRKRGRPSRPRPAEELGI